MKKLKQTKLRLWVISVALFLAALLVIVVVFRNKKPVSILIIGDSISAGAGASSSEYKWFKRLPGVIKDLSNVKVEIENDSLGGNDTYSAYCRIMRKPDDSTYNIILICSGANDGSSLGLYYENLLWGISNKYPEAAVFCILQSSEKENPEKVAVIQELADYYGAYTIDMIEAFEESEYPYNNLSIDGVHPNDLGQDIYLSKIGETLSNYLENGKVLAMPIKQVSSPINQEINSWGDYSFYSLEDMKKINDFEYELIIPKSRIIIGYDYISFEGNNYFEVSSKDTVLFNKDINQDNDVEMEFNNLENINCEVEETITVLFSSEEMKNHFLGLNITKCK